MGEGGGGVIQIGGFNTIASSNESLFQFLPLQHLQIFSKG